MLKGIVFKSTGSWYIVRLENGDYINCRLKGQFRLHGLKATNPVAVGDNVYVTLGEDCSNVIVKIEERFNYIIRRSTNLSKQTHIIAANIDHAYIVVTLAEPRTSTGFIDRFLVTAEAYHIDASIIFNKIDIYDDELMSLHRKAVSLYQKTGYSCLETSAFNGDGVDNLRNILIGKTNLFAGHSGVGKSALINSIDDTMRLKIGEISAYHKKGKHTTTFAEMMELKSGGFIIDTPGIKEFGLIDFRKDEVGIYFPEMKSLLQYCQFYNCTHSHEPNCAVKKAVEQGEISPSRYKNYLNIINDENLEINDWE